MHTVARAAERIRLDLRGATAVVQGFGNVGSVTAAELASRGTKVTAVSDHAACLHDARGLPVEALAEHVRRPGTLASFSTQAALDPAELLTLPCDVLVPAALERVIDASVASRLRCRILAEGANGPVTPDADAVLDERRGEIFVVPDILCYAGGVIVSYFEWEDLRQLFWEEAEVNERLARILDRSFDQVVDRAVREGVSHRTASMAIGVERVWAAKQARGLFP